MFVLKYYPAFLVVLCETVYLNTSLHRSALLELKFHLGGRINVLKMSTVPIMEVLKKEMGREREASGLKGRGESGREGEGKRNRRKGKK